jgi:hypothetical protein
MGCVALLSILVCGTAVAQPHQYHYTAIASLDSYGLYMEPATITNRGDVLFAPSLLTGGEGVVAWRKGIINNIALANNQNPAPGGGACLPGYQCPFYGYTQSPVQMADNGDVAFIMTRDYLDLPQPQGIDAGVYRYTAKTGVLPVMLPGTPAPSGGKFWGSFFIVATNNRGDIFFPGMVCTDLAVTFPTQSCPDGPGVMTYGAYKADKSGRIATMVGPGDPAPGGSYFDFAHGPASNVRGDFAFTAHIFADPCYNPYPLYCWDSVFLKQSPSGKIIPIAKVGDPSPVPGRNYGPAFSPLLSPTGDVLFLADVSQASDGSEIAVFFWSKGKTIPIAVPGTPLPGGGFFKKGGFYNQMAAMNNAEDIAFFAVLQDDTEGVYLWRRGHLSLVAKTGASIEGGVIDNFDDSLGIPGTQVAINDVGQVIFTARYQGGGGALVMATPK